MGKGVKMRRTEFSFLFLLFLLGAVFLGAAGGRHPELPSASAEEAIGRAMKAKGIPGLSAAVLLAGEIRWAKGYGLSDLENDVPTVPATLFRLASVSKTLTAVAVMQLAERGKLDLDAPIQKYCPKFPEKPWPVTARELLAHLAGVRHYNDAEEAESST